MSTSEAEIIFGILLSLFPEMPVEHLDEALLVARTIRSLGDENSYLNDEEVQQTAPSNLDYSHVHLIPEFVEILPVPLPLLFVMSLVPYFMPVLEREVDLCCIAHRLLLCALDAEDGSHSGTTKYQNTNGSNDNVATPNSSKPQVPLVALLREATTLFPASTYDRLEFLGDSVLGYFLAINALACNGFFEWDSENVAEKHAILDKAWDSEDMAEHISIACRNITLAVAAQRFQLENLMYRHAQYNSAYSPEDKRTKRLNKVDIPNKTLSDGVESLLCSAFLADDVKNESLVVYILNLLKLPFPRTGEMGDWFKASGAALRDGYPLCTNIKQKLSLISRILQSNVKVRQRLELGQQQLEQILSASRLSLSSDPDRDVFLQCALFDDDLMENHFSLDGLPKTNTQNGTDDFLPVVLLRENLYVAGTYALQLMISKEFYERFQHADSNDLHLLRACVSGANVLLTCRAQ